MKINIGQDIKKLRKSFNLTQTEFGDKIDRNLRTVQKYESGEILPPLNIMYEIDKMFGGRLMEQYVDEIIDAVIKYKDIIDKEGDNVQVDNKAIKPNHYKSGGFDVISFCQIHEINFELGNVIKYVTRAGKKENNSELQDLLKAREFLNRRIKYLKGE